MFKILLSVFQFDSSNIVRRLWLSFHVLLRPALGALMHSIRCPRETLTGWCVLCRRTVLCHRFKFRQWLIDTIYTSTNENSWLFMFCFIIQADRVCIICCLGSLFVFYSFGYMYNHCSGFIFIWETFWDHCSMRYSFIWATIKFIWDTYWGHFSICCSFIWVIIFSFETHV